jgi:hypothetical protein
MRFGVWVVGVGLAQFGKAVAKPFTFWARGDNLRAAWERVS